MVAVGLSAVFVWVSIWFRFREVEPPPPPEPADLRLWDFLGCRHLRFDTWLADNGGEDPETDPPTVRSVMLFADSVDAYGREMTAYKAVALEGDGDLSGTETRWFTRADTLWVVWSSPEVRGAVALRRSRGEMVGRAVARLRGPTAAASATGDAPVQARATSWEVNCHSLRPNRIGPVDR